MKMIVIIENFYDQSIYINARMFKMFFRCISI